MAELEKTNPDCLEIKTRSVEQTLLPLIKQVTTVVFYLAGSLTHVYFVCGYTVIEYILS